MTRDFWPSAVYLANYLPTPRVLAHTWSLALEEQFYLALARTNSPVRLAPRTVLRVISVRVGTSVADAGLVRCRST